MADVGSGTSKPTGKYAERILAGAWPESDSADLYAQQEHWRALRDQAREQFRELSDNAAKLRHTLQGDGFDSLHRDRELVARNFDFLQETRDDAARIWEHGGEAAGNLRRSMAETVRIVEQEIATIEEAPGLDEPEKEALIDALIEAANAALIGQNAAAAAALASEFAGHLAYMGALPWHVSAANAAPYAPPGNGVQSLKTGWKLDPSGLGGSGQGGAGTPSPAPSNGRRRVQPGTVRCHHGERSLPQRPLPARHPRTRRFRGQTGIPRLSRRQDKR